MTMKLNISDEIRALLEQRHILDSDVQQAIDFAESSGTKLVNRQTGHFLAHYRPEKVTFWVEYTAGDKEFIIHNAYSHRMVIIQD